MPMGTMTIPVAHSLFFEFAGTKSGTEEEAATAEELMRELGCNNWETADTSKERHYFGKHAMNLPMRIAMQKGWSLLAGMSASQFQSCLKWLILHVN